MTNTEIADTYFEAYRSRDITKPLLAPDVTMQHAVTPRKLVGKDTVIDYMLALMSGIDDVKIERHLMDGEYVATIWEAHTVWVSDAELNANLAQGYLRMMDNHLII